MNSLESRIQRLEERQPCVCMVAVKYLDGTINWSGVDYPDEEVLGVALKKSGLEPPLIILNDYGGRDIPGHSVP